MISRFIAAANEHFVYYKLRLINRVEGWRYRLDCFNDRVRHRLHEIWIAVRYPPFFYVSLDRAAQIFYEKVERQGFDPVLWTDDPPNLKTFRYALLCAVRTRLKGRVEDGSGMSDVVYWDEMMPLPNNRLVIVAGPGRAPGFYDVRLRWVDLYRTIWAYRVALRAHATGRISA